MNLTFYAQVRPRIGSSDQLDVVRTTKHKPTGPDGHVIKFNIEVPEGVIYPEVKASLVGLETMTDQAVAGLQAAAKSLRKP